ncbi:MULTISPECIES: VCBS repeat-containing protein [unclassified Streptomyces]|uniref:VCBS repeat-containing protein n=1 Tax=unclassified Streptomyces TaxID=2593676 RepID=UPI002365FF06|nr:MULTISPECIES: VCBS repeat-containing protein [unclassified Streptomyces]MDF3142953.1 VCBS repeat-containing protein [Streptomyces sp. T21Q-yed]WDF40005.1 VCBS repeat-containing protein [Streptomyces sp. T12]
MHKHHPRRTARLALATATAAALTGGLLSFAASTATAADSTTVPHADFNGDGIGDVAFSADGAYVSGKKEAGQLVVLYGTATGVSSAKRHTISQNTTGSPGTAEAGDHFGYDTAYADFNGDGYDDIAVGAAGEDVGSDVDGGGLAILWGSASGITGKGVTIADPAPSSHDRWGKNLAAGDFDGDGKADLAVGSNNATLYVFKGGFNSSGVAGGRYTIKPPIMGSDANGPLNLSAGDVNGDGRTDLVVDGYEYQTDYGWNQNYYIPGASSGLAMANIQTIKPGVITAIGDINGDGFGDIVSGAQWNATTSDGTSIPDSAKGGKVWVTYGTVNGPGSVTGITQDTGNVPGASETNDWFGYELDLGDINGDGFLDLAIGVAGENIGSAANTGAVTVLYGSASGLNTSAGAQSFAQSTAGVPGDDEDDDMFGIDLKLDDVTGDGKADLIAGSAENDGNGGVTYLPSDGSKITTTGSRSIAPSTSGVSTTGTPYFGANFAD